MKLNFKKYNEAENYFRRALEISPHTNVYWEKLALSLYCAGQIEEAIDIVETRLNKENVLKYLQDKTSELNLN